MTICDDGRQGNGRKPAVMSKAETERLINKAARDVIAVFEKNFGGRDLCDSCIFEMDADTLSFVAGSIFAAHIKQTRPTADTVELVDHAAHLAKNLTSEVLRHVLAALEIKADVKMTMRQGEPAGSVH